MTRRALWMLAAGALVCTYTLSAAPQTSAAPEWLVTRADEGRSGGQLALVGLVLG